MPKMNLFIPITKVDAAKRLVYGVAAVEELDKSNEIFDYDTSKPFFMKWSGDIEKATDGKSLGNVRAMHGKVAAGKLSQISFNDDARQIEVCAKIVDDNEWTKVDEGVYTGFSIGGGYEKRWKDGDATRYTANPAEVSIVDNPCQPSARFSMVKMDGSVEERPFASTNKEPLMKVEITNDVVAAHARVLAKAAGDESRWGSHVDAARAELEKSAGEQSVESLLPVASDLVVESTPASPSPDLEQVWKAADGSTFKTKAEAKAHNEVLAKASDPAVLLAAAVTGLTESVEAVEKAAKEEATAPVVEAPAAIVEVPTPVVEAKKDASPDGLRKGLYQVGRLASLIQELMWLQSDVAYEANAEMDGSALPVKLKTAAADLCSVLRDLVVEETEELFDGLDGVVMVELATSMTPRGADALVKVLKNGVDKLAKSDARSAIVAELEKAGARNSKKDLEKIQGVHDHAVDLGATCDKGDAEKGTGGDLQKALSDERAKTAALEKAVGDALPVIAELQKRMKHLEDQPRLRPIEIAAGAQPEGGVIKVQVVSKADDDTSAAEAELRKTMESNPGAIAEALIRMSQRNPQSMLGR